MDWKYLIGSLATGVVGVALGLGIGLSHKNPKKNTQLSKFEKLDRQKPNVFVIKGAGKHSCVIQSYTYKKLEKHGWYLNYLVYNCETKKWEEFRQSLIPIEDSTVAYDIANLIHNEELEFVRNEEEFDKALEKYGTRFSWSAFSSNCLPSKLLDTQEEIEAEVQSEHKLKKTKKD